MTTFLDQDDKNSKSDSVEMLNKAINTAMMFPLLEHEHNVAIAANRRLTQLLVHVSQDNPTPNPAAKVQSIRDMQSMVQKYESHWPRHENCSIQPVKEYVVMTGTTGGLGSHILVNLLNNNKIERIWAINRKSSKGDAKERQIASFRDKLLDVSLLESESLRFLDTDCEESKLGLCEETYNEIKSKVTLIIHNAWKINFNHPMNSFEPNIRSTRNLLDLAFLSNASTGLPRFAFLSSIAVVDFSFHGKRLNEAPISLEDAVSSNGYGQSKVVGETLLESARRAGLQTCILRLGQMCGDIKSGSWATTQWIPSIIGSSVSIGCFPGAIGNVSWLPLDVGARLILEICLAREAEMPPFAHVSHTRPVAWNAMLKALSSSISARTGHELPIVRFDEWHRRVIQEAASFEGSKIDRYKRFPSTRLQNYMDGIDNSDKVIRKRNGPSSAEFGALVSLDTTVAQAAGRVLDHTPELGVEYVEKWVNYWISMGLLRVI